MGKLNNILVPIPMTEDGIIALNQAEYFRKTLNLNITVLHVIPDKTTLLTKTDAKELKKQEEKAEKELRKFLMQFYKCDVPKHVQIKILTGNLVETIVAYSHKKEYDLVIIKKAKRKERLLGIFNQNDADKVIARSFCPVITLNESWNETGIKTIMLPVDVMQKADKKVNWSLFLAKMFKAKVIVFSALRAPIAKDKSLAYKKAASIKACFEAHDVPCEYDIVETYDKKPHEAVMAYAREKNPDLIMVMTHKEIFSLKQTIGTCATEVIHEAQMPIFTFIPDSDTVFNYLIRLMSK